MADETAISQFAELESYLVEQKRELVEQTCSLSLSLSPDSASFFVIAVSASDSLMPPNANHHVLCHGEIF